MEDNAFISLLLSQEHKFKLDKATPVPSTGVEINNLKHRKNGWSTVKRSPDENNEVEDLEKTDFGHMADEEKDDCVSNYSVDQTPSRSFNKKQKTSNLCGVLLPHEVDHESGAEPTRGNVGCIDLDIDNTSPHIDDCRTGNESVRGQARNADELNSIEVSEDSVLPREEASMLETKQPGVDRMTFGCDLCGKSFRSHSTMRRHIRTHTRDRPHHCPFCEKTFMFKYPLETHMRHHTGEKPYICSLCGKAFIQNSYLQTHMRRHIGDKPHTCQVCDKAFTERSHLTKHMKLHSSEKPFVCVICNKAFKENSALRKHTRIHDGVKPYICSVCNRAFAQTNHLRTHMRMHTGEKPFICSMCDKAFTDSSDLKKHLRVHTGEKPFMCVVCKKCFRQSGYLTSHMRMHTGEKPYSCSLCGKSFQSNSNLVRHIRIHTGEKPFQCSICCKKFLKSYSMKRHMMTCTGGKSTKEKRHQCPICYETFTKSFSVKRHLERAHPRMRIPECPPQFRTKSRSSYPILFTPSTLSHDTDIGDPVANDGMDLDTNQVDDLLLNSSWVKTQTTTSLLNSPCLIKENSCSPRSNSPDGLRKHSPAAPADLSVVKLESFFQ